MEISVGSSCNICDLYSGGDQFKSRWVVTLLTEVICSFPLSLQANAWLLPNIRP
jgi:hypothetical protein